MPVHASQSHSYSTKELRAMRNKEMKFNIKPVDGRTVPSQEAFDNFKKTLHEANRRLEMEGKFFDDDDLDSLK